MERPLSVAGVAFAYGCVGVYLARNVDVERDWYKVPPKVIPFFKVSLALAAATHLISLVWLLATASDVIVVSVSAVAYMLMNALWLPLAKQANNKRISKWVVRALFVAAAVPLSILCALAYRESLVLGCLSLAPLLHTLIMDLIVYGFTF